MKPEPRVLFTVRLAAKQFCLRVSHASKLQTSNSS